jgi:hypothetical protein
MIFNKRFIKIENLELVREQGLDSLIRYITNPDCLIINGDLAKQVCDIVGKTRDKKEMVTKLKEIGFIKDEYKNY